MLREKNHHLENPTPTHKPERILMLRLNIDDYNYKIRLSGFYSPPGSLINVALPGLHLKCFCNFSGFWFTGGSYSKINNNNNLEN